MSDTTSERDALLHRILAQVPFDGWTAKALAEADPAGADMRRLFPRGTIDIVTHFADWADREMERRVAGGKLSGLRIRDTVALLVKARLEALEPHREAVRREAAWVALHAPDAGARLLWRSADRMWRLAGDTATDFNHYSKRALLSGVIASTTLCWLGDATPDRQATHDFLDRRIENVMQVGKLMGKAKAVGPARLLESAAALAGRLRYRG